ncbi:MAG: nucleotidyltransferase domain-containing protein [Candidatus Aenigmarchaeota archaeon]|nr:nucleotidyltransferase domain-containing protein [Candidatus Aenigmarchaeota archaeon]
MRRRNINVKDSVKHYFFMCPTVKLRVRQIEKKLKLSLPSVIRYCRELKNEGILQKTKTSNVVFYTANRTNNKFLLEKRLFNIKQIHDSKLIEHLKQELINPSIILFGSYAKGEDVENSDIDLYIETLSKKEIRLSKFEEILKRKLQLFRYRNIKNVSNAHLANNIVNGITLNGFVEVFK